jgi:Flp pilus assembly protein TadD
LAAAPKNETKENSMRMNDPGRRCLVLLAMTLFWTSIAFGEPRNISAAEEAAVRLVAAHLSSGPDALWQATSASSRLRNLGAAEGRKEIELRVGPADGSEWRLITMAATAQSLAGFHVTFASGVDDTIVFEMIQENGAWKIADLRSMSDPVAAVKAAPVKTEPLPAPSDRIKVSTPLMIAGAMTVIFGVLSLLLKRRRRLVASLAAAAAALAVGVLVFMDQRPQTTTPIAAASVLSPPAETTRASMVDLRRRAASGESTDTPAGLHGDMAVRAALWSAQLHLGRNDFAAAADVLSKVPGKDEVPLAHILAGRTAFLQNRDVDAVLAYERAMELGPERDDLLYETASVLMILGFDDRAERYYLRLVELGSREPDAYYSLAILESIDGAEEKAEKALFTAYQARPLLRSSLVRAGVLHRLVRRPAVRQQLAIQRSDEPLIQPARLAEKPLTIPPGAGALCIGEHLEVDFIGRKLQVPGGAFMAPIGTRVLDAGAWDRMEATRALGSAPVLAGIAAQPSTYAQPALARRVTETASTLAAHHRWNDVKVLTAGVTTAFALVPPDLVLLKAQAQKRTGDMDGARRLLAEMIGSPTFLKRLDAGQLLETGEMLASLRAYDAAIRIMDRAGQLQELPRLDDRVRQISMNKQVAQFNSHRTPHFIIRYPSEMDSVSARTIGDIAEAEFIRIQRWVPISNLEPVAINVLTWETFRGVYTGGDHILGFYDGQITIPFAGVGNFEPEIVAILSHELAHAMIAQRTHDQAPRWFQEGLAQRVESVQFMRNPFNMYDPEQFLAFRLLDDMVMHSGDYAMVSQGYLVAHALIRYIEQERGQAGLVKLLDAFAAGMPTDEAIEAMSGKSLSEFDQAFAAWGHGRRHVFENTDLVTYDESGRGITIGLSKR